MLKMLKNKINSGYCKRKSMLTYIIIKNNNHFNLYSFM